MKLMRLLLTSMLCAAIHASSDIPESTWRELTTAIVRGNLDTVKTIVPSQVPINAVNEPGYTALEIAQNSQRSFDAVTRYLQSQLKSEYAAKEKVAQWTSEHGAAARELDRFLDNELASNKSGAQKNLAQAILHVSNIINAAESVSAKSEGQSLQQKLDGIEEIIGKNTNYVPQIKELYGLLSHKESAPSAAASQKPPTADDEQKLKQGLENGALFLIQELVPSRFKPTDTMPDGQKITTVATFHQRRHEQIVKYLQSLQKEGAGKGKPDSPTSKRPSPVMQ